MKRWRVILGIAIALAVLVAIFCRKDIPPQIITLPNGEQYRFVAAEWGTSEVQPTFVARTIDALPARLADFVAKKWGNCLGIVTPVGSKKSIFVGLNPRGQREPSLHFWFRSIDDKAAPTHSNFKFMLADKNGAIGGRGNISWAIRGQGKNKWLTFDLPVAPRRSDTLQLFLFQGAREYYGPYHQIGTVRFPNPLFGHFPDWKPESVPATKAAGDLRVTLSDFTVAAMNPGGEVMTVDGKTTRFHPPEPSDDRWISFKLDINSPRGTNEAWTIRTADLTDVTGNRAHSDLLVAGDYFFGPALWPDESAWQLVLTLKKLSGYDPEELVAFTNVPVPTVGSANTIFRTNSIHGVPVILKQEFIREPDRPEGLLLRGQSATHITVELLNHPKDFVADFIEFNTDAGRVLTDWSYAHGTDSTTLYLFSIPTNAHTLNITWVVQQTRTVKFLVKPPTTK